MYKRRNCDVWTVEDTDYWFYIKDKESEDCIIVKDVFWNKDAEFLRQIDVVLDTGVNAKMTKLVSKEQDKNSEVNSKRRKNNTNTNRFKLGFFKDLKIDGEQDGYYYCNRAVFVVCDDNYLDDVKIKKDKKQVFIGYYDAKRRKKR